MAARKLKTVSGGRPNRGGAPPDAQPGRGRGFVTALLAVGLVAAVWLTYGSVLTHPFIMLDDADYVYGNPAVRSGLNPDSARWALTATAAANWHPLTWLSHMLDVELFGLDAGRHHGVNLVFHTLNALLLLLLLESLTGAIWRSALASALFALHPLHVESVAWVAERKDVLSTLVWLLTVAAWIPYARRGYRPAYAVALALFALGLMAKPMLVTLPFTLLLLDFWPLRRLGARAGKRARSLPGLLLEKVPFFALSAASSVVTVLAQRAGGALVGTDALPFAERLANAAWAYGAYLQKAAWPVSLAVFYPLPAQGHPPAQVALAAGALLGVTAAALLLSERYPFLIFGWLWFLGTLIPVIGLVQVSGQSMADRYTYVPLIGCFIAVAWGVGVLAERRPALKPALLALCALGLMALAVASRAQLRFWGDSVTLFRRALEVAPGDATAHNNLGIALASAGRTREAGEHFRNALAIRPDFASARANLGKALLEMGLLEEAARECREAVRLNPGNAEAHITLGAALGSMGRPREAREQFELAIRLRPNFAEAHNNLGLNLARSGLLPEAAERFREAIRLQPDFAAAKNNLSQVEAALRDRERR